MPHDGNPQPGDPHTTPRVASSTMGLRALLAARRRTIARQLFGASSGHLAARLTGLGVALVALAGAGALSVAPLERAAEIAELAADDPALVTTPGGPYVDLAFWIGVLLIAVQSFRIMEALYRHRDARVLATLPLPLGTQFAERILSMSGEAALGWLGAAAYLLPIFALTGQWRALGGLGLIGAGLAVSLCLGVAIQLYAGVTSFPQGRTRSASGSAIDTLQRFDTGGGTAAAFTVSPGIAMGTAATALLLMKLAVVDEYLIRGTSRLFWIGVAVPTAAAAASLWQARVWFLGHYPRLLARFYESDLIQFDSGYNYHRSVTDGRRGLFERVVPDKLLGLYRKDALQLGRRYPMLRLLTVALWIGVGVAASRSAQGQWLPAALVVAYTLAMAAPWARLYGDELEPGVLGAMPIPPQDVHRAKALASIREVAMLALPSALICALLAPMPGSLALAAVAAITPTLLTPLMLALTRRVGAGVSRAAGLVLGALALVGGGLL